MIENKHDSFIIAQTIAQVREQIAAACRQSGRDVSEVQLMAVTKTVEAARVNAAIAAGVRLLGENKAQELCAKYEQYDKDEVDIHFIGHLQTNKVRQIIDKVCMIQSLDRLSLAQEIQNQCERLNRQMECLVEVNIGSEFTKSGVAPEMLENFLLSVRSFDRLKIRGIMAIPPICDTEIENERNFERMHQLFVDISSKNIDNISMDFLSMGMSGDYLLAIKHGSNLVRLGTILFGHRVYP
ncbi:MAG: YggS family pyridoxal phosphate-dependent enzyme [Anaerotruncus sp.]|nr:YggS family pyridoxal phosphate-dependent enzyme [Anaerotruncus sp.]